MIDVFISYASSDKVIAERVCGALENAGISCWMAPRNIEPGTAFPTAIVEAVNSARAFVLILTEHTATSPHVLSEVSHAFNGKKRIIPLRIWQQALPEDLEYFLSLTQWLDAPDGCTDQNLRRLVEATLAALTGEPTPRPLPPLKSGARWLAGAVLTLVVVGGMIFFLKSRKPPDRNTAAPTPTGVTASPPGTPPATPPLKIWSNPADELNYVWIPAGTFMMGCSAQDSECKDNEKPTHQVNIEKGFWLGQTEVTVTAYRRFAAKSARHSPAGEGALPVSGVSWADAKEYCAAMGVRLPTEAEWEYAARAGSTTKYSFGDEDALLEQYAWYNKNDKGTTHPVGQLKPNAWGLYDMMGNVWEWVQDWRGPYASGQEVDPQGPATGNARGYRGGGWGYGAVRCRVADRSYDSPDYVYGTHGFRLAMTAQ